MSEPLENTEPITLHQADTPEPTPAQDDFDADIWAGATPPATEEAGQ